MATTTLIMTAAGFSTPIPINLKTFRGGVGIVVNLSSGTVALYDIQVTGQDLKVGLTQWNQHDILQGMSVNANSNLVFPVTGLRMNLYSINSGGSVYFSVIQVDG